MAKRQTRSKALRSNERRAIKDWTESERPREKMLQLGPEGLSDGELLPPETIVNALVHRDYLLSGTTVELSIYEDRLEVVSPGRLPNGITPQRMVTGCRSALNQLLRDVMRDYGYLEHMGMGVPRKIVKGMQKHNGSTPELIEDEELFTVRLWNR